MSEILIPIAAGSIFALLGLAILVDAVRSFVQQLLFRNRAQHVSGRVIDVQRTGSKFQPLIEYMSSEGTKRFRSPSSSNRRWNVGDEVTVAYDPENRKDARLLEGLVDTGSFFAGVLGGGLGLGLVPIVGGIQRPAESKKEEVVKRFITAAESGDINTVRQMLTKQPDLVNATVTNAWTGPHWGRASKGGFRVLDRPLHAAARGLQPDVAELLLDRGVDANATILRGVTALHVVGEKTEYDDAASAKRVKIIQLLLARGAKVNAQSRELVTPLHRNVRDPKAVELLLAHGANVNARNESGETPLLEAAAIPSEDPHAVELLLDHGADIRDRDREGNTPLMRATTNLPVLELLLKRGASVRVRNTAGETPLHEYASNGGGVPSLRALEELALLCSSGLRPDVRDPAGKTSLDLARDRLTTETHSGRIKGAREVIQFLLPGGPCDRLARTSSPASKEQREFIAAEFLCADGEAKGCATLGWDYDTGSGVQVNKSRAAELYKQACDAGAMWTCFNLAVLYANGEGVAENRAMSMALYRKACDGGDADACRKLEKSR